MRAFSGAAQSELSAGASAVPLPPPPAAAPVVTAVAGNAKVTLTWNALPDATSYKIYRSTSGVFDGPPIASTTATTFKNYSLTNGTTYLYTVAGKNMGGEGPRATAMPVTPLAAPPAPQNVAAAAGNGQVTLSWLPSGGAVAYNIYRGTRSNRQATMALVRRGGFAIRRCQRSQRPDLLLQGHGHQRRR